MGEVVKADKEVVSRDTEAVEIEEVIKVEKRLKGGGSGG